MTKVRMVALENKDQAQAMADFLWNEKQRHLEDICKINLDLNTISDKWNVLPRHERIFVET